MASLMAEKRRAGVFSSARQTLLEFCTRDKPGLLETGAFVVSSARTPEGESL